MLPKFPAPKLPTIPTPAAIALAAGATGLIVASPHPAIRLAGLGLLSCPVAIAHRRIASRATGRVLKLVESNHTQATALAVAAAKMEGAKAERDRVLAAAAEPIDKLRAELSTVAADRDRLGVEVATLTAQIADRERAIESARAELKTTADRLGVERDRLSVDRVAALQEVESTLAQLRGDRDRAIDRAATAADHAQQLEQALASATDRAEQQVKAIAAAADQRIAAIAAELGRYKEAESERLKAEKFDQSLLTVADKIGREFKPVLVCGGQGSGKATTAAAVLHHYAGGVGCIPFVLDVSEGGQLDSTWTRAGIPSTDNVRLFIDLMDVVEMNLGSRKHRTDPDFSNQPPIIFVIDELQTVALSLPAKAKDGEEKYTRENFISLVRVWHTRGAKYGCYLFACNQSDQIQNMRAGTLQIFNGGHFADFHVIRLNDVLLDRIAREPSLAADSLGEYLSRNEGRYTASFQTTVAGTKMIEPIAHPSHAGQALGSRTPTRLIPIAPLSPCPRFIPTQSRAVYGRFCRSIAADLAQTNPAETISNPNPNTAAASTQTQPELSPLAIAIDEFARSVGGSISPRDFVRNGGKFYAGARSLKAEAIAHVFEVLERQGAGRVERGARGAAKYRATTTGQA